MNFWDVFRGHDGQFSLSCISHNAVLLVVQGFMLPESSQEYQNYEVIAHTVSELQHKNSDPSTLLPRHGGVSTSVTPATNRNITSTSL